MTNTPPERTPTYTTNPLDIQLTQFSPDGDHKIRETSINFADYAERPLAEEDFTRYILGSRLGKHAVEVALIDSPSNTGNLKIVHYGWGGNIDALIARLEAEEIRRQNPDDSILIINNPSSGNSAPIPRAAMKEMKRTGSFAPYGELLANAIRPIVNDYDRKTAYGHSMGARTVISTVEYLGSVDCVTATDPPGSRELGLAGLANAFMIKEGGHAGRYAETTDNALSLELQKKNDELGNTIRSLINMGPRGAAQMFLGQTGAMSKDGLRVDLERLLQSRNIDDGILQINSPEFSELNSPYAINTMLADFARNYPNVDIRQAVLLGQTHSVNVGGNSHTTGALSRLIT